MKNRRIKYVIFDFDGTLADSGEIAFRAMNSMADSHKFRKLDWSEIEKIRKMNVRERSRYMGVPMVKIPTMAQEFYRFYKEHMGEMHLNKGIPELIENLHQKGYKLAVISSNDEGNIRDFLNKKSIDIDDILCSSHIFSKDGIINKFLRRNKLDPSEILYIGDETRDISACRRAKVKVAWVDWGLDVRENAIKFSPDYMISDPAEIEDILVQLEDGSEDQS
ncbi:MAG: HAD-IA family hydrolase [Clostridia bacterium]|nr:HAD-IA family hydrolase [Clostridia bacterium]